MILPAILSKIPPKIVESRDFFFCLLLAGSIFREAGALSQDLSFNSYITSDHIAKLANFVVDENTAWFDPNWVSQGDILYIDDLDWFEEVLDQIRIPYILISTYGDRHPNPQQWKKILYNPKCAAWFCRGLLFSNHPKLHQFPFGLGSFWGATPEGQEYLKAKEKKKPLQKSHLLYMNHFARDSYRKRILKLFQDTSYCFSEGGGLLSAAQFYDGLSNSHFVISPRGLETDCVRSWEALLLDCVPIMEHTFNDSLYDELPVVLIHEWEEINEPFLRGKMEQLSGSKTDKAYFAYWEKKIKAIQNQIRRGDFSFSALEATQWDQQDIEDLNAILEKEEKRELLIYKGALTTSHPLQIAHFFPYISAIYLHDPWMNKETLRNYLVDPLLIAQIPKISLLNSHSHFIDIVCALPGYPVLLDLTYYRHGICCDHIESPHSLEKDLFWLYFQMGEGTLLCGNEARQVYVREVLARLKEKFGLSFALKGNFWFISKTSSP